MINFKKEENYNYLIVLFLILMGISLRLFPYLPNFSPIAAIALFGGVYLSKKIALVIPLVIMVVSDIFIGYYEVKLMIFVYGCFFSAVIMGFWIKKHKSWRTILGSSILSAVIFFLVTNFAVWIFTPWYEKTSAGLIQCYLLAIPFFKNNLFGNLFYMISLFGSYEIITALVRKKIKMARAESLPMNLQS